LATHGARIFHELFGAGSGKGDRIATRIYEICDKLVNFGHACNKLRFCLRVAEAKQYDSMVAERDTLDNATREIENLLDLAGKDEISYDTPLDGLSVAQDNVSGFVQSNFVEDEDDHSELATLVRRGPPKIHLEVQRLLFQQCASVSKIETIADLLGSYQAESGDAPVFQRIFEQIESLQQSNKELTSKILTQSVSFEILVGNSKSHNPNMFKEELELCFRFARGGVLRLKELLDWVDQLLIKPSELAQESAEEAAKKKKATIASLDTRFEMEMKEGRLIPELQSIRSTLEGLAKKLDLADTKAGEVLARPVWETRALEVRQELMQAASLKMTLEEATKRTEAKTRELFAAKKLARDNQAMVEVLTSKIAMLQSKTNEVDDLMNELERLRKRDKEFESSAEVMQKEREKYTTANAALRQKNLKLKYELKRLQDVLSANATSATPGYAGKNVGSLQGASEELNMLSRTIAMQRQQISTLKASLGARDLSTVLAPLPVLSPVAIHTKDQHRPAENIGVEKQLQASDSPFALAEERKELQTVQALKQDLSQLTARARNARAAPVLVDLSKKESANQQWHASQASAAQLSTEAAVLEAKLSQFLSSKQSAVFRSLAGTVPVMGSSVPGGKAIAVGPNDKLIGKLSVPLNLGEQLSAKVLLRPSQLQELHSVLVA